MGPVKIGILGCCATTRCMYGPVFKYLKNGGFAATADTNQEQVRWAQV